MKRILAGIAVGAAALFGLAAPASAVTGNQSFSIVSQGDGPALVVASGVVSGLGSDFESDSEETARFEFANGGFTVDHPATSDDFDFNPLTCIGTDRFTGTYTLRGGTGAYAGIRGSGTYRGRAVFVGKRLSDGSCSDEEGFTFFTVRATGTTTLP